MLLNCLEVCTGEILVACFFFFAKTEANIPHYGPNNLVQQSICNIAFLKTLLRKECVSETSCKVANQSEFFFHPRGTVYH